jgi:hypothetical protein
VFSMIVETRGDDETHGSDADASIHWDVRYVVDRREAVVSTAAHVNESTTAEHDANTTTMTTSTTASSTPSENRNYGSGKITMQFTISKDTTYAIVLAAKVRYWPQKLIIAKSAPCSRTN